MKPLYQKHVYKECDHRNVIKCTMYYATHNCWIRHLSFNPWSIKVFEKNLTFLSSEEFTTWILKIKRCVMLTRTRHFLSLNNYIFFVFVCQLNKRKSFFNISLIQWGSSSFTMYIVINKNVLATLINTSDPHFKELPSSYLQQQAGFCIRH